jgi:hypothetical protein
MAPVIARPLHAADPVDPKEEKARQNLRLLAHGLDRYMRYNEGKLPAHLSELYAESFVLDLDVFTSPASGNKIGDAKEIDAKTDYLLAPRRGADPQVFLKEKKGFHGGKALTYYSDRTVKLEEPSASIEVTGEPPKGSTKDVVKVPAIVGMTAADAKKALAAVGLTAKFELGGEAPTAEKAKTVAAVDPAVGTQVAKNSDVKVTIYGEAADVTEPMIKVPNVVGLPIQKAKDALQKEGLKPKLQLGKAAPKADQAYQVYEMAPASGRLVAKGSEVLLTIYGPAED